MKLATQIIEDIRNGHADALLTGSCQRELFQYSTVLPFTS